MTALTKAELAEKLFEDLGLNKREAKDMVDIFFDEIRDSLSRNEQDLVISTCVISVSVREGIRRQARRSLFLLAGS